MSARSSSHLIAVVAALACSLGPACAGHRSPHPVIDLASQAPVLPAITAQIYAPGQRTPADPVVALAAAQLPVDEALSGGAAALALEGGTGFTIADARWAALRAGYPFSVRAAVSGMSDQPVMPEEVARGLAQTVQPGDHVGLARARFGQRDAWVALVATPLAGVPAFSRQHELGQTFELSLPIGSTWSLVSPEGDRFDGTDAVSLALQLEGEWWLDARVPDGRLSLPIYVELDMPPTPVLELPGQGADGPGHAADLALNLLNEVRAAFELPALSADPTLQTLALAPLERVIDGSWQRVDEVARLRSAGFLGGSADQAWCEARTVALCLESLLRTADGRVALLDDGHRLVGAATRVESRGVTIVLNLASE